MKKSGVLSALCLAVYITAGCSTTPEKQKAKDEKKAQREAFFEEGKMDDQVQSWKRPGGRY